MKKKFYLIIWKDIPNNTNKRLIGKFNILTTEDLHTFPNIFDYATLIKEYDVKEDTKRIMKPKDIIYGYTAQDILKILNAGARKNYKNPYRRHLVKQMIIDMVNLVI